MQGVGRNFSRTPCVTDDAKYCSLISLTVLSCPIAKYGAIKARRELSVLLLMMVF